MGRLIDRAVGELGSGLVLAPERYDPHTVVPFGGALTIADVAELVGESRFDRKPCLDPTLVLDTTHAFDGFVLFRHGLTTGAALASAKRILQPGDVIISRLRPYLRQAAWVPGSLFSLHPKGNRVLASPEFWVLRGRGDFDLAALVPYLLSAPVQAALAAAQGGGHHPRVPAGVLTALPIPDRLLAEQARIGAEVRAQAETLRATVGQASALITAVEAMLDPPA